MPRPFKRRMRPRSPWLHSWPGDDAALAQHAHGGRYSVAYQRGALSLRDRSPCHSFSTPSQAIPSHGQCSRCRGHFERSMGPRSRWLHSWPGDDAALAQHVTGGRHSVASHCGAHSLRARSPCHSLSTPLKAMANVSGDVESILSGAWDHAHPGCIRGLMTMRLWRSAFLVVAIA